MLITEGTNRDFLPERADPSDDSAWAIGASSARVVIRRNGIKKK
jgi:hypothetical protein